MGRFVFSPFFFFFCSPLDLFCVEKNNNNGVGIFHHCYLKISMI